MAETEASTKRTLLKNATQSGTLDAAHTPSAQHRKKTKEKLLGTEPAKPTRQLIIEDGPAGLRFLNLLERLAEEQSSKSGEAAS